MLCLLLLRLTHQCGELHNPICVESFTENRKCRSGACASKGVHASASDGLTGTCFLGQAYGDAGLERWVDTSAELAQAFARKVEGSQGAFQLVMAEAPFNVCFWWMPHRLRPYRPDQASAADKVLLSKVHPSAQTQTNFRRAECLCARHPLHGH